MKKLYILGLMGLALTAQAQTPLKSAQANKISKSININSEKYTAPSPVINNHKTPSSNGYGKAAHWQKVGETYFDRQTNSSIYRRILAYPDGKISINWLTSSDGSSTSFLARGSGYNHFNGSSWGPVSPLRIEQNRAGYPNLDYNGTTEIIMSHRVDTSGKSGGLIYNTNGAVGSTTWSSNIVLAEASTTTPTVLWPRTAISGDYMHVIANYTGASREQPDSVIKAGVRQPTVYSRYKFSTSTWEVENITLPNYDSTRWVDGGADGYALDANGSNVAILIGANTSDITLWKSSDNGSNWTTTIIDSFPFPAFNNTPFEDTLTVTDGSFSVRLDSTGNAHCFWGRLRISWNANTDNLGVFLGTNSIDYWYEGRPDSIVSIGGAIDTDGDGELSVGTIDSRSRYGNAGVATMPHAVRNANGDLYVVFSALTEGSQDAGGANFRDVHVVFSKDNGATWSLPQNLTSILPSNPERMFGSAAIANNLLHITFMQSEQVGFYDATDNPSKTGPFDIMHYDIPLSDLDSAKITGVAKTNNNLFTVSSNYPNPFHNNTTLAVTLTQKAAVTITVMNILGEVVYNKSFNNNTIGVNEFEVNAGFKSGFYFYTVEAGGFKTSGKMLAE